MSFRPVSSISVLTWLWRKNFSKHWQTTTTPHPVMHQLYWHLVQGDHLSRKPWNVGEFDSYQGFYWKWGKCHRIVREKILSGKRCLKVFIVNCRFVSIQVFCKSLLCLKCQVYGFKSCTVAFLPQPLRVTLVQAWYEKHLTCRVPWWSATNRQGIVWRVSTLLVTSKISQIGQSQKYQLLRLLT